MEEEEPNKEEEVFWRWTSCSPEAIERLHGCVQAVDCSSSSENMDNHIVKLHELLPHALLSVEQLLLVALCLLQELLLHPLYHRRQLLPHQL